MKRGLSLILCFLCIFSLSACQGPTPFDPNAVGSPSVDIDTSFGKPENEMFTARDLDASYDAARATRILLNGRTISCDASDVSISGANATILGGGTYILSGTLEGTITVHAGDTEKPHIILDGVDITAAGACILVLSADKVVLTLAEGSENILVNDGSFAPIGGVNVDGAIFSTADLTLNGTGALSIYSVGGHGIVSNDDLVITGGDYMIDALGHALKGNDSVRVCGEPLFSLTAEKDGVHAENNGDEARGFVYIAGGSFTANVGGDAISASAHMQITDGTFALTTGGGHENGKEHESGFGGGPGGPGGPGRPMPRVASTDGTVSAKGLKAGGGLLIEGGSFTLDTADDALHSNTDVVVKGGSFAIKTGDDALHADVSLAIFGGTIDVSVSYEGLEAKHVEMLGGNVKLVCEDDGINAAGGNDGSGAGGGYDDIFNHGDSTGTVNIAGGELYMNASGDGIDANGTFTMSGGKVTICGPTEGDTAVLDYDKSAIITGGYFIGTGSQMMAQSFSRESTQGVIALSVGNQAAGTRVTLSGGAASIDYTPILPYQILVISTPDMVKGEEYTVTVGTLSGKFQAY